MTLTEFGKVIKSIRESRGMSVETVATLSGVSEGTIRKIEHGTTIAVHNLMAILSVLNYDLSIARRGEDTADSLKTFVDHGKSILYLESEVAKLKTSVAKLIFKVNI